MDVSFYEAHRDVELDLAGIERLIEGVEPTAAERRSRWPRAPSFACASWASGAVARAHVRGAAMRAQLRRCQPLSAQSRRRRGARDATHRRARVRVGRRRARAPIGHSLGSVIAYDALWDLSHERASGGPVDLFVTMGSPLATHFVRRRLRGAGRAARCLSGQHRRGSIFPRGAT